MLQVRRGLLAACLVALSVLIWRSTGLVEELVREREAARLSQQGSDLLAIGQYAEAASIFRRVLVLAPRSIDTYGDLAEAEFRRKQYDAAIEVYRQWLAIYPYTYVGVLYRAVGLIELRAGRPADARVDFSQAVALDPADWWSLYLLGHAYRRLNEIDTARAIWQKVIRLRPNFQPAYEQLRRLGN